MARTTIIVMAAVIAVVFSAPQGGQESLKSPANMSYDELQYILGKKRGEELKRPKALSPCARAILGCCTANRMNTYCSEQLNCGAFFFDDNPCDEQFIVDALNAAKSFYTQFSNST